MRKLIELDMNSVSHAHKLQFELGDNNVLLCDDEGDTLGSTSIEEFIEFADAVKADLKRDKDAPA